MRISGAGLTQGHKWDVVTVDETDVSAPVKQIHDDEAAPGPALGTCHKRVIIMLTPNNFYKDPTTNSSSLVNSVSSST